MAEFDTSYCRFRIENKIGISGEIGHFSLIVFINAIRFLPINFRTLDRADQHIGILHVIE